jgi:hypothetical protein
MKDQRSQPELVYSSLVIRSEKNDLRLISEFQFITNGKTVFSVKNSGVDRDQFLAITSPRFVEESINKLLNYFHSKFGFQLIATSTQIIDGVRETVYYGRA